MNRYEFESDPSVREWGKIMAAQAHGMSADEADVSRLEKQIALQKQARYTYPSTDAGDVPAGTKFEHKMCGHSLGPVPKLGGEVLTCAREAGHDLPHEDGSAVWDWGKTDTFVTKDSGQRVDYPSGMRRDVADGKPRFDLIPLFMLRRLADLYARGAVKYGDNNWQLADSEEELQRFKASAFRHFVAWLEGERDEDHGAAVFFNIAAAEHTQGKL